jgi:hypothetical protein
MIWMETFTEVVVQLDEKNWRGSSVVEKLRIAKNKYFYAGAKLMR